MTATCTCLRSTARRLPRLRRQTGEGGQRVQDIAGVDGQALLNAIVAQGEAGEGWVEYNIANPVTGAIQAKMSTW